MSSDARILSSIDKARLFDVGDSLWLTAGRPSALVRELNRLLNRGAFVDAQEFPPDVVTMNSRVRVTVQGEEAAQELTLVFPDEASNSEGRVSILTPMAQALLGARVGQVVTWQAPMGQVIASVDEILYQPEANLNRS